MGRHSVLAKPYPVEPATEAYPFAVGDVVIVDGVAPGRVRGIHPSSAEVSVRMDEDNNLHRMNIDRVVLYVFTPGIFPDFA